MFKIEMRQKTKEFCSYPIIDQSAITHLSCFFYISKNEKEDINVCVCIYSKTKERIDK